VGEGERALLKAVPDAGGDRGTLNLGHRRTYIPDQAGVERGMSILVSWLATAVALMIGDRVLSGVFVGGLIPSLIAAAVLGLVNITIKPILFILTLPITLLTLGLFTFVINAMMLALVGWLVGGFQVESLLSALGLALIVAIVHALAVVLFGEKKRVH
jgi:putative membrane protein